MSEQGERLAILEVELDNMKQVVEELKSEMKEVRKTLYMLMGGLSLLQILATLWLKFGGTH